MMKQFDDNIPSRAFDNFQFVNFTHIMSRNVPMSKKEAEFALAALMEIPSQYKATVALDLLGCRKGTPKRIPLPPPLMGNNNTASHVPRYHRQTSFEQNGHNSPPPSFPAEKFSQNKECPICLWSKKDLAFECGHLTCYSCGKNLVNCPICQAHITNRIRLYDT
ncbi:hypothetical protein Dimus_036216 [Dionaea muscipula]